MGISPLPYERQDLRMGTFISQMLFGRRAHTAGREALRRITLLEECWSLFIAGSEISRINRAAGVGVVAISAETLHILQRAQDIGEMSGGAFDISSAPLKRLWRRGAAEGRPPSCEEIEKKRRLVDYRDLRLDSEGPSASLSRIGQGIDLGGIGKGYAADKAVEIYRHYGVDCAFINLGGNVLTLGGRPDGSPWRVGIRCPASLAVPGSDELAGYLEVYDSAVVTSGDYEDYFEYCGRRYHHIIDPATGLPADSGVASVTVTAPSAADADALATAVFVMGQRRGLELINKLEGVEVLIIDSMGKLHMSRKMEKMFSWFLPL